MSPLEIVAYSETAVVNNAAVVEYCRISMAALSGGTAGLLGLTGLYGFGFYIFAVFGLWVRIIVQSIVTPAINFKSCTLYFIGNAPVKSWRTMEKIFHKQTKSFNKRIFRRPFCILCIVSKNVWSALTYLYKSIFLNTDYYFFATDICAILDVSFQNMKYPFFLNESKIFAFFICKLTYLP